MTDEADDAQERMLAETEAHALRARQSADIPKGEPGECERCFEESPRLVRGACARCRDRLGLP